MYIDKIYTKLYSDKDWNGLNQLVSEIKSFARKDYEGLGFMDRVKLRLFRNQLSKDLKKQKQDAYDKQSEPIIDFDPKYPDKVRRHWNSNDTSALDYNLEKARAKASLASDLERNNIEGKIARNIPGSDYRKILLHKMNDYKNKVMPKNAFGKFTSLGRAIVDELKALKNKK